jgi:hypothetical protein
MGVTSGGAPASISSATVVVKPEGPSLAVCSPQRWWGDGAGLS